MLSPDLLDDTHDPARVSWVAGSGPGGEFPIQNLPYCMYEWEGASRVGVGIGDAILDLHAANGRRLFASTTADALAEAGSSLQSLMGLPAKVLGELRGELAALLTAGSVCQPTVSELLHRQCLARLQLPATPPSFTDFFASVHHARNAGELRRPGTPLLPNFHHLPVAYNGRPSTVRASGTEVVRPWGQVIVEGDEPAFLPTRRLDFECELAVWMGSRTFLGERIDLPEALSHVFGIGLLNDWSARDIQLWESQPLGPLLSKSFLTTVSPWVVTMAALAPFRLPAAAREPAAPPLQAYLDHPDDRSLGAFAIQLTVSIQSGRMRALDLEPHVIARPNFKDHYWTVGQMLAHLTSNGCCVAPGELIGTGTVSGPARGELGCLLELTRLGRDPFELPGGESRTWLEDGDEVVITGACNAPGFVPIGLGEARGRVVAPRAGSSRR